MTDTYTGQTRPEDIDDQPDLESARLEREADAILMEGEVRAFGPRPIHEAVRGRDPAAARKAAMDHITYVEQAMAEAERTGDWQRISRLRLRQRMDDGNGKRAGG